MQPDPVVLVLGPSNAGASGRICEHRAQGPGRGKCYLGASMSATSPAPETPALPDAIRRLVSRLGAEPGVRRVVLFGSRARGDAGPRSDVDLAVDAPGLAAIDWLRLVDMAEGADSLLRVDLVRLDQAPGELRARIEAEGRTIHGR